MILVKNNRLAPDAQNSRHFNSLSHYQTFRCSRKLTEHLLCARPSPGLAVLAVRLTHLQGDLPGKGLAAVHIGSLAGVT